MPAQSETRSGPVPLIHFVDTDAIRTNLHARVSYLVTFIGLTSVDVEALQGIAPLIRPAVADIVDAMYRRLWSFDITRNALVEPTNPHLPKEELNNQEYERMRYMASFMNHWVLKIFIADWEDLQTFGYFDRVGLSHIGENAFRHRGERGSLRVDYVHIGLLLGVLSTALTQTILALEKPSLEEKTLVLTALTKVMWIQNDLMSRHYIMPVEQINPLPTRKTSTGASATLPVDATTLDAAASCPFSRSGIVTAEPDFPDEPWPDDSDSDDSFPGNSDSDEAGSAHDVASSTAIESPVTPAGPAVDYDVMLGAVGKMNVLHVRE